MLSNSGVLKALFGGGGGEGTKSIKFQNVIHITELIRTFQLHELEEFAAKSGTVKYCWVNKIKSEAYIVYETAESAIAAFRAMNGLQWPKSSIKRLQVAFSTEDEFSKVVREDAQRGGNPIAAELWKKLFPDEELVVNKEPEDSYQPQKRKGESRDMLEPLRKLLKCDSKSIGMDKGNENGGKEDDGDTEGILQDPILQKIPLDELFIKTKAEPHIYYLPLIVEEDESKDEPSKESTSVQQPEDGDTNKTEAEVETDEPKETRANYSSDDEDVTYLIDEVYDSVV